MMRSWVAEKTLLLHRVVRYVSIHTYIHTYIRGGLARVKLRILLLWTIHIYIVHKHTYMHTSEGVLRD